MINTSILFDLIFQYWYILFLFILVFLTCFIDFKKKERKELLNLLLNKYYIISDSNSIFGKTPFDLFKKLIYSYSVCCNDMNLKGLAKFYFLNKEFYFKDSNEQYFMSIVLRWETEVGMALIEKVKNNKNMTDPRKFTWKVDGETFNLTKWNSLYSKNNPFMVDVISILRNLDLESNIESDFESRFLTYIEYLDLDFIPLQGIVSNRYFFYELKNVTLNYAKISESNFLFPIMKNVFFDTLIIYKSSIMQIDFKNATYANKIILDESSLFKGSLISPNDKNNNIDIYYKKTGFFELLISIFSKKIRLFKDLVLVPGTSIKSKELYDYYNWYSYYVNNNRRKSKFVSIIDLIITKYYTSTLHILLSSICFILLYAVAMYKLAEEKNYFLIKDTVNKDFFSFLYFSMTNFTTLGFGEIIATNWLSHLIITSEVFIGYYMLAMIIAVASKRTMKYS